MKVNRLELFEAIKTAKKVFKAKVVTLKIGERGKLSLHYRDPKRELEIPIYGLGYPGEEFSFDAARVLDILRHSEAELCIFKARIGGGISLRCGENFSCSLLSFDSVEVSEKYGVTRELFAFDAQEMLPSLRRVTSANTSCDEDWRPELRAVRILCAKGKIDLMATNGQIVFNDSLEAAGYTNMESGILVNSKEFLAAARVLRGRVSFFQTGENWLEMRCPSIRICLRTEESKYFSENGFDELIGRGGIDPIARLYFDRKDLVRRLRRLKPFCEGKRLAPLVLRCNSGQLACEIFVRPGDAKKPIAYDWVGFSSPDHFEQIERGFTLGFVLKFISNGKGEKVSLDLGSRVLEDNLNDKSCVTLWNCGTFRAGIMPVKLRFRETEAA